MGTKQRYVEVGRVVRITNPNKYIPIFVRKEDVLLFNTAIVTHKESK